MDKQEKLIARLFKDTLIIFLLSMFAEKAGTFIDGVITGKFLGTAAIAAFGLTVPYQNFAAMFIRVMALGMQILCSKILGAGKLREANGIFSLALTVAVGVAIVMFGITILFTGQIIDLLGSTAEHDSIRALAIDYLQAYSFALPAIALATIFTPIMQLDNDRRRAVISVVVLSISNIAGDLINIFVLEGGLWGMGIATAISYWFAAGFLFLHFLKPTANFKFTLEAAELRNFREMFLIGSPVIMVNVSLILRKNIFNRLALNMSSGAGLAAYTILGSVSEVLETFDECCRRDDATHQRNFYRRARQTLCPKTFENFFAPDVDDHADYNDCYVRSRAVYRRPLYARRSRNLFADSRRDTLVRAGFAAVHVQLGLAKFLSSLRAIQIVELLVDLEHFVIQRADGVCPVKIFRDIRAVVYSVPESSRVCVNSLRHNLPLP